MSQGMKETQTPHVGRASLGQMKPQVLKIGSAHTHETNV